MINSPWKCTSRCLFSGLNNIIMQFQTEKHQKNLMLVNVHYTKLTLRSLMLAERTKSVSVFMFTLSHYCFFSFDEEMTTKRCDVWVILRLCQGHKKHSYSRLWNTYKNKKLFVWSSAPSRTFSRAGRKHF